MTSSGGESSRRRRSPPRRSSPPSSARGLRGGGDRVPRRRARRRERRAPSASSGPTALRGAARRPRGRRGVQPAAEPPPRRVDGGRGAGRQARALREALGADPAKPSAWCASDDAGCSSWRRSCTASTLPGRRCAGWSSEGIGQLRAVDIRFSYFNDDPANIRNSRGRGRRPAGHRLLRRERVPDAVRRRAHAGRASVHRDPATGVDMLTAGCSSSPAGTATFTVSTRVEPDQRVTSRLRRADPIGIPFNIPPDGPTEVFVTPGGEPPGSPTPRR